MDVPKNISSKALTEADRNANLDDYASKYPWMPLSDVEEFMKLPAAANVSMEDYEKAEAAKNKKKLAKRTQPKQG